mgnify:FL=1
MKHFAVIGNPIEHSLSPVMHRWIFNSLNIDADYIKVKIEGDKLSNIIHQLQSGDLDGINVTIPYKEVIIDRLDEINPRAQSIGSVNCIMKTHLGIIGNNTDWYGFSKCIEENHINLIGRRVIVLGAGGTSRSILFSIKQMGVEKIQLLNRNIEKALSLTDKCISVHSLKQADEIIREDSIIINTTSVGMQNNDSPLGQNLIHENQILIDVIYTPLETSLLKYGKQVGALTFNGLDMFIHQALASIDLWFGSSISKQVNLLQLKTYLESQLC